MKKYIAMFLALAMMTALIACGGKTEEKPVETTAPVVEITEAVVEETEATEEAELEVPETEEVAADSEMKALIDEIYANHGPIELMLDAIPNEYFPIESIMESITYYTGLADGSKIAEIAISEPMMGQAYSLVVLKVTNADDAAAVAQEMYDNIDMRKWICVEADTKTAAYCGDIVMFFMVNSDFAEQATPESMVEAFKATVDGEVTVIG